MDKNHSIIYSLLKDSGFNEGCFKSGLEFVEENQPFNSNANGHSSGLSEVIASINVALHGADDDRSKALRLLEKCLLQCSSDIFTVNAILWMQHCTRWSQSTIIEELRVLDKLISMSVESPDLKKQISAIIIPRVVERLNSCKLSSKKDTVMKLRCLRNLIDCYSSSCGPFRNQLHKYIVFSMKKHSENDNIISQASRCLVSLLCCGGGGQQGANYKEKWSSYFKDVLSTCQKLVDELYGNIEQFKIENKSYENVVDEFLELKEEYLSNPTMRYYGLRRICYILTNILQCMLLCKFPVSKSFHVENILNLICRILSVTCVTLQDASLTNDTIALNANISFVHSCAFNLLHALIIWKIRTKAYHTLSTWLEVAGSCSSIEVFADELIPLIVSDIEYRKQAITLVVDNGKKKNKRKRGQFTSEMSVKSGPANPMKEITSKSICQLALKNLQLMFANGSIFIKWEHHKNLQCLIINLLTDIAKCNAPNDYPSPYSNAECRLMLYKSLFTLCMEPHPKWFPPTSYAVNLFNAALNDSDIQVSGFCRYAINMMEVVNHPKAPTIHFSTNDIEPRKQCDTSAYNFLKHKDTFEEVSVPMLNKVAKIVNANESKTIEISKHSEKDDAHIETNNSLEKSLSLTNQHTSDNLKNKVYESNDVTTSASCSSDLHNGDSVEGDDLLDEPRLVEDMAQNDPPPSKKFKNVNHEEIQSSNTPHFDADVSSMLNDFVDTV